MQSVALGLLEERSELSGLGGVSAVTVDLVPGGSSRVTVVSDGPPTAPFPG